jgi:hypothetical protein
VEVRRGAKRKKVIRSLEESGSEPDWEENYSEDEDGDYCNIDEKGIRKRGFV